MSSQDRDNFVQKNNNNNEHSPLIRHWQWPQQPQQQLSQQPQQLQQLQQSQWPQQPQQQFSQQPQQLQQHQQSQWPQQPQHHQQSQWPQQPQYHQWSQPQSQLPQWSDEIENELVEVGISLPEKYFVNGRYPKTSRPSARSPNELSDPSGYSSLNQQQLSNKLNEVAKSFRKTWSYWRNMLWDKINESSSGLNIAASMDLSKYEINYEDYEDELIVCSSSENEDEGQRTKGTPKKQSTNKRNI
ncbi:unnamed protein product [Rhizophagus irregularis]|nr:unnamed protein product [Rhizophagus irregularis]